MQFAPIPKDEKERLEAVHKMGILDTEREDRFDILTKEAVVRLKVPISTLTILDNDREWFKSAQGIGGSESERDISFCGHALLAKDIFIVEDTLKDIRFADNPMVIGKPYIRAYAGIALIEHKTGHSIGVFCVKDTKPRSFTMKELNILVDIAARVEDELNK